MPIYERASLRVLLALVVVLILSLTITSKTFAQAETQSTYTAYTPAILHQPTQTDSYGLMQANYYRQKAGVPSVTEDTNLSNNCFEHARYMAENDHLTHHQDPNLPYASEDGQICAERGNAWIGGAYGSDYWEEVDSVEGWMASVGHRLWLIYPTTTTFGFGFYETSNNRAGAALDVLTTADFGADETYPDWPIRYPSEGDVEIPHTRYPITLNWRYFGSSPVIETTNLQTAAGAPIPHEASTELPAGHKGIQLIPSEELPPGTTIVATVTGSYDNVPFNYTWQFTTEGSSNPYP